MTYYVRAWRQKKLITQEALFERTGVARDCISRIERGLQEPRPGTVRLLARGLGISVEALRNHPFPKRPRGRN